MLFAQLAYSQQTMRSGQIVSDSIPVAGAIVVNISTEKEAFTNENGFFKLALKAGDLLIVSHPGYEYRRKLIEQEDLASEVISINIILKPNELAEVVVTGRANQDDLIMRHKDPRKFTPAERKLYTASSGPVDILLNALSGRTNQLKKELQVEMNERLLARVETLWEPEYYTNTLRIPEDYIRGFQYYLIEDTEFVAALKERNKTLLQFLASKHAVNYNNLISE